MTEVFLLQLSGKLLVHRSIKFAGTQLFIYLFIYFYIHLGGERNFECFAQKHNKASKAKARTQIARSCRVASVLTTTPPPIHSREPININYIAALCFQGDELFVRRYQLCLYHKYHINLKYLILGSFKLPIGTH